MLECGRERQRDRLPRLMARLWPRRRVRGSFEQDVGVGLKPDWLRPAGGLGRLGHGRYLMQAASAVAERVQAAVGRDPVEPGAQRGAPLEALESAPGRQERLLEQILGVLHRSEDPVAVQLQLAPVGVDELAERVLVPGAGAGEDLLAHHRILTAPLPFARTMVRPSHAREDRSVPAAAGVSTWRTANRRSGGQVETSGGVRSWTSAQRWVLALSALASLMVVLDAWTAAALTATLGLAAASWVVAVHQMNGMDMASRPSSARSRSSSPPGCR
jgi:hypothetical protein